jgi:addiction module HigA family antidote
MIEGTTMAYRAIDNLPPVHPGEFLADELAALHMSARKFAAHLDVPPNAITTIVNGQRGISAEMALRLGQVFGTGERYWMSLQSLYEAKLARGKIGDKVANIAPLVPVEAAAGSV